MRYLLGLIVLIASIQTATAERFGLPEAMQELRERGAKSLDAALIFGDPLITGEFDGQGFNLSLGLCDRDTLGLDCRSTVFSACRPVLDMTPLETLEMANAYNLDLDNRGTMYRDNIVAIGEVACMKVRRDMHDEDVFDLADIFDWQLALRDFEDHVEVVLDRRRSKSILGFN